MNLPIGSIWRKWDLHVHTAASYEWSGGPSFRSLVGEARDNEIRRHLDAMQASDVAVFSIMDYWTFDGYKALRDFLRRHPEYEFTKTLLPGMELRCEAPADYRLNIHVLLSDELTTTELDDFKAKLRLPLVKRPLSDEALIELAEVITQDKLRASVQSYEKLCRTQEGKLLVGSQVAEVSREDLYLALAGTKGRGFLLVPWETYHGLADLKQTHAAAVTDFMNSANIYETRKSKFIDLFQGRKNEFNQRFFEHFWRAIGEKPKATISGSDAHAPADYGRFRDESKEGERATWIKADPTFEGLRQAVCEPVERCYIGIMPPDLVRYRSAPTKYLTDVEAQKVAGSTLPERWFDFRLPLNPGMVAVIGNKGSGKSALADILGLLVDTDKGAHFSFLTAAKFCRPRENKAAHFQAKAGWLSGEKAERNLGTAPPRNGVPRARYIPQSYLEQVCNEIDLGPGSQFDKELKAVIFSHVPQAERLEKLTIDELISYKQTQAEGGLATLREELHSVNVGIAEWEDALSEASSQRMRATLALKESELAAHDVLRPVIPASPEADPTAQAQAQAEREVLQALREEIGGLDDELQAASTREREANNLLAKTAAAREIIAGLRQQHELAIKRISTVLDGTGIDATALVTLNVSEEPLAAAETSATEAVRRAREAQDLRNEGGPAAGRELKREALKQALDRLEGPTRAVEMAKKAESEWLTKRREILGDASTPGSVVALRAALDALATEAPKKLEVLQARRIEICRSILSALLDFGDWLRRLYAPVQKFAAAHSLITEHLKPEFDVRLYAGGFERAFFDFVSQGAAGSFYGVEDGSRALRQLVNSYQFGSAAEAEAFVSTVIDRLRRDHRQASRPAVSVPNQLKRGKSTVGFYDFLFGLDYLQPQYVLRLGGKEITQLSPGERGTLLLIFYLLVDQSDEPLIIDQPEENLDNRTVFRVVGACLREARRRRQIILVTHNPNLAVACDADQIIVADHLGAGDRSVVYVSGSIENPQINKMLLEVLEGTQPAFENRNQKYRR